MFTFCESRVLYVQTTDRKSVTVPALREMKQQQRKIAMLTAYDASLAAQLEMAGVDVALVGDSLGMVIQGHDSTLPVTIDDVVYHCAAVSRGLTKTLLVADLPFMSDRDVPHALDSAARLVAQGSAAMVKLEGAGHVCDVITALVEHNIPVCAHLGLTPQSVHRLGGYRVQGRGEAAQRLIADAHAVAEAGASMLVLECVPAVTATQISTELDIPVIGIGAGVGCDGQVLVIHDMLGITPGKRPRFSKDFLAGRGSVAEAIGAYVEAVREGTFPAAEHAFE